MELNRLELSQIAYPPAASAIKESVARQWFSQDKSALFLNNEDMTLFVTIRICLFKHAFDLEEEALTNLVFQEVKHKMKMAKCEMHRFTPPFHIEIQSHAARQPEPFDYKRNVCLIKFTDENIKQGIIEHLNFLKKEVEENIEKEILFYY